MQLQCCFENFKCLECLKYPLRCTERAIELTLADNAGVIVNPKGEMKGQLGLQHFMYICFISLILIAETLSLNLYSLHLYLNLYMKSFCFPKPLDINYHDVLLSLSNPFGYIEFLRSFLLDLCFTFFVHPYLPKLCLLFPDIPKPCFLLSNL